MTDLARLLSGDTDWEAKAWGAEWDAGPRWANEDGMVLEYQDWSPETSRVVSGPLGPPGKSKFRGHRFTTRSEARAYWASRARIIAEHRVPGRWIYRITTGGG